MIDDLEKELLSDEEEEQIEHSTTSKFPIKEFFHPGLKFNVKILSMSVSKTYINIITDNSELLRIESETLIPVKEIIKIPSPPVNSNFKENITKIWTNRCGNHSIIRYKGGIYYYNSSCSYVKQLQKFSNIEICAVGFDDINEDTTDTRNFLVIDYNNKIYECKIFVVNIELNGDYTIEENIEKIIDFNFLNIENEDDDLIEQNNIKDKDKVKDKDYIYDDDRIYGIKFFKATKSNLEPNDNTYYIMAVSKKRLYQFIGPGLNTFKQIFDKFKYCPSQFNECCKYFPENLKIQKNFKSTDLNILYKIEQRSKAHKKSTKTEVFNQFGWKTESGFCFGRFTYDNNIKSTGLPYEQKKFTVIPFSKINNLGIKEDGDPIDVIHTNNHIFILYSDCFTVISKLTCYIIHTQYFKTKYEQMIYNEFGKDNGVILLSSQNGSLYQISLKDENSDIWKDYLEIGDFSKAKNFCSSKKAMQRIYKLEAEKDFYEENNRFSAATKFANSDEKFENVCLQYLMKNDIPGLNIYLQVYMESNLNKEDKDDEKKADTLQVCLICTWMVEIFLNQLKSTGKSTMYEFRQTIRDHKKYFNKELIYELLLSYGRIEEFIEFSSMMFDFEKAILYYINLGEIDIALEKIEWFLGCSDDEFTLKLLTDIFTNYSHMFLQKNPRKTIFILQNSLKDVKLDLIIRAITSTIENKVIKKDKNNDKDNNKIIKKNTFLKRTKKLNEDLVIKEQKREEEERRIKEEKNQAILEYLKSLMEKPKVEQESNIHNLYLYFLYRNKALHQTLLEYLQARLKMDENPNIYFTNKKKVLFQLDYAKKLFKNYPQAYSLVLALGGKYMEGVKVALMEKTPECEKIAKFIAFNAPDENLQKKLWIEIFSKNSENVFEDAIEILNESKILKIEDILPHIHESININDFKNQIFSWVQEYEKKIDNLKENINDSNISSENIKNDITKSKRKPLQLKKNNLKCSICQKEIEKRDIFLFPCGHLFDMYCIKEYLINYEVTGVDYLHDKNVEIDELFFKLGFSKKRDFDFIKKGNENENDKKKLINKLKILDNNTKSKKNEDEVVEVVKDPKKIQVLKDRLINILSEQCALCGDFMIDSLQYNLDQKDVFLPDKKGIKLKIPKEFDFMLL